jgi:hypothetical protein
VVLRLHPFALAVSTLLFVGCSEQKASEPPPEIFQQPKCEALFSDGKQVRLDSVGTSQFQATAAFDGAVWVAYAQADQDNDEETNGFDVWATRLDCDGSVLTAPFRVNTALKTNDLDPAIAVGHGQVLVAWLTDSGEFPNNLTIRYRLYNTDGTAAMADERILMTTVDGQSVDANMWQPSVAATPTGFAIAGTRAPADAGGFRTFVQRIDAQGNPVRATIDGHLESGITHQNAALGSWSDGTLFVAWARTHDSGDLEVFHGKVLSEGTTMLPDPPIAATAGRTGNYPTMSASASGPAYLAYQSEQPGQPIGIIVKDASVFNSEATVLQLGANKANSFAPRVAAGENGGAVAWFVQGSGSRSLAVRGFGYDGSRWTRGPQLAITAHSGQIAASVPGLTHLGGQRYFVTWAEGTSPDTVLFGRFVQLEPQ